MQKQQGSVFKGIYEFEDPSGILLAAKSPITGSADLYSGTTIIVKPNQMALFIYKGQITEVLTGGEPSNKDREFPLVDAFSQLVI